jgi:hypothetical protein
MAGVTGQPQPVATGKSAGMMHQYPTLLGRPIAAPGCVSCPDASHGSMTPGRLYGACLRCCTTPPRDAYPLSPLSHPHHKPP